MNAPKARPTIASITVKFSDGTPDMVIDGHALADPKGGALFWNDFGLSVLKDHYHANNEHAKATAAQGHWDKGAALLTKPNCTGTPYP